MKLLAICKQIRRSFAVMITSLIDVNYLLILNFANVPFSKTIHMSPCGH